MRYNNVEKYDKLHRTFNTLKKIKSKNWTKSFKDKAISEYHNFRNHGIEVSDHFLSKYINRKGKNGITKDLVITLFKNYTPNYLDKENNVRFYNGYRLVTNHNDIEIIVYIKVILGK